MTFDSTSNELSWNIEFSGLTGNATAAHFHGPAAAGNNTGVQINIGEISGLASPMNGTATLSADQASQLLDGMMYINIHTEANPDGEIRGQVVCVQDEAPPTTPPTTPPAGEWETATLTVGDEEFDIQYMITNATLDELTADVETATLTAMITADEDGELTIQLPREIIDSVENGEDADYLVFVDEVEDFADDDFGEEIRTLTIPFPAQSEQIDFVGTTVIPEFGAVAAIVLAVAIVGIIVATTRSGRFS
ncbi:MAG: CHRD domain-containing protein, partial [Nitrososphaera sp.]|uniref:CHRD domain-containing protein n=1 Tax=Nitrososphaera sp. TaxID=1971748 RepID=UPI003D700392